ncbi:MAG TPA: TIGR03089 family protein [Streptosporangiaceae bacterium]|nr:TIGR03089 family protein [Streptosporangiaceae bacterium]
MSDPTMPGAAPPRGLADVLRVRAAERAAAPLVTFYDDATGERIELSGATFGNWVAKTANLLVDGLGAQPGDRVALALPPHWQTAVWLFACWSAGLVAAPVPHPLPSAPDEEATAATVAGADVLAVTEADLPRALAAGGAAEVVGLSLHALGGPLGDAPAGITDYAADIRAYGDQFAPYAPVDPDAPALHVMSVTFTGAEVTAQAVSFVSKTGLDSSTRVLTMVPYHTVEGLLTGLLAPIIAGGSIVITRNIDNTDKAALERRISLEHVTAVAGVPGWDPPSGSVYGLP